MSKTVDAILKAIVDDAMSPEDGMDALRAVEALDESRVSQDCQRGIELIERCIETTRRHKYEWDGGHINPEDLM